MSHPFASYPGGNRIRRMQDLALSGKRVFLRVDFNVPMSQGKITDDTRIRAALPTLEYLFSKGAKVICASHLGRPKGIDPKYSLTAVAERLGELTKKDVLFSDDCRGEAVVQQSKTLKEGGLMLLENLRFNEGEEKNNQDFSYKLSRICDVYVNDAFGTCHRAHASTAGLPALVKDRAAGFLLEKEIGALAQLIYNPERPLIAILGGSKVSDKIKVIEALMTKSSRILIGGAMAYTFLRALNVQVGESRVEVDYIEFAKKLLERANQANCKIILPVDHRISKSFDNPGEGIVTENAHIPDGMMGLDIGPKTCELFQRELGAAKSIFWNGPLGVFEKPPFDQGTFFVAKTIAGLSAPIKVCGGGDSVAAIHQSHMEDGFTHISTGGGASLEMIEGEAMPGIEALKI